jgi:hypothetical protein
MKSHSCENDRGVGSMPLNQHLNSELPVAPNCEHITPGGRRCRMLSLHGSGVCAYHARRRKNFAPELRDDASDDLFSVSDDTAAELLAGIKDFKSTAAVNLFLGNVVKQVVRQRMNRRDAVTLAYLSQLLLNSLSVMSRERLHVVETRPRIRLVDDIGGNSFDPSTTRPAPQT